LDGTIIILYFGGSNNIFADCIFAKVTITKSQMVGSHGSQKQQIFLCAIAFKSDK
jgi:hypothetical protein